MRGLQGGRCGMDVLQWVCNVRYLLLVYVLDHVLGVRSFREYGTKWW